MIKNVSNKELDHIRKMTGDKNMSESRLKSERWFLPSNLTIGVHKYLKAKGKMK